jgi:TetR/AcrR family transcriptional regulator, transcriptional repressor for nem operon
MRYKTGHKAQTRVAILTAAGQQLRAQGIGGVSVSGLMAQVHLTHGGFYEHFASKEELVSETVLDVMLRDAPLIHGAEEMPRAEQLAWFIRRYLSRTHRDHPETGCMLPALSGEIAHQPAGVQAAFAQGFATYVERVADLLPDGDVAARRDTARYLLASMAGTVALARAMADPDLSDAILTSSRHALLAQFGIAPRRPINR